MRKINIDNIISDFFWETWYNFEWKIVFDLVSEDFFDYIYKNAESKNIASLWIKLSWKNESDFIIDKVIKTNEKNIFFKLKYTKNYDDLKKSFVIILEKLIKWEYNETLDNIYKDAFIFLYKRFRSNFWVHLWNIYKKNWVTICPYCNINKILVTWETLYGDEDHILPKSNYFIKSLSLNNLIICCASCNRVDKLKKELDPNCNPLEGKSISDDFYFLIDRTQLYNDINEIVKTLSIWFKKWLDEKYEESIWNYLWYQKYNNSYVSFKVFEKHKNNIDIESDLCNGSSNWKNYFSLLLNPASEKYYSSIDNELFNKLKDDYAKIDNFHKNTFFKFKYDLIFNQDKIKLC